MSTHSLISLPPELEMTPRSLPLLSKKPNGTQNTGTNSKTVQQDKIDSSAANTTASASNRTRTLLKLSETSFLLREDQPLNLRILLRSPHKSTSSKHKKQVNFIISAT